MKEKTAYYCQNGYGCAGSIFRAAQESFGIDLSPYLSNSAVLCPGFGIGSLCSALVACLLVLGILFAEDDVKRLRVVFLSEISARCGSLNCCQLSARSADCGGILLIAAEVVEELVLRENPSLASMP